MSGQAKEQKAHLIESGDRLVGWVFHAKGWGSKGSSLPRIEVLGKQGSKGPLTPQILFVWGLFPFKIQRKRPNIKNSEGGGLGGPKIMPNLAWENQGICCDIPERWDCLKTLQKRALQEENTT